jgi:predicted transport protein
LLLSQTDKTSLISLLGQHDLPTDHSIRIKQNFDYFVGKVGESQADLSALCDGLAKLVIVDISLDRDADNPQEIFESLNSTGRELSQADLIRNFILMGLEPELQTSMYDHYWRPIEIDFGQEGYTAHFDSFMRHYLTVKTGEIPNVRAVYEASKQHSHTSQVTEAGVEAMVADIRAYAGYYCAMALGREPDSQLKEAFQDIRELKVDVAFPFLLEMYRDYSEGLLEKTEFLKTVRLVESYVFRRAICSIPTNSMNKTFAGLGRSLKKDRYFESIQANLLMLPSYRRFPDDDEFERDIQLRDLYNFRSRSYWLRRLENFDRKERVLVDEYTIEHILPQNEHLSAEWQAELGTDWQRIQQTWLHTLGNLTLTGYNSELSDRPFLDKRDMKSGFAESPLRMNLGLGDLDHWGEHQIKERASKLAKQAVGVWPSPKLEAGVLDSYKPTPAATASEAYAIGDHPHLASGPIRDVFDAFRNEVLALDPVVTEEFRKLYVAYKAETNFVDVIPQAKRLRLTLNLEFPEVSDPKGICEDITNLGRWGNGDVSVGLAKLEEVPYVMGLVRQSFEKQMGNGADA